MSQRIELLIVDPQNDFCDPSGTLFVNGADNGMARLAAFLRKHGDMLSDITVTLDSHHHLHVAHPAFWRDNGGRCPVPFMEVTAEQVESGRWKPGAPSAKLRQLVLDRLKAMESAGHTLRIWPTHCVIGTPGHNVFADLRQAIGEWECREFATVNFVTKGGNPFVDWRSAVQAVVPDPNDPTTYPNSSLIEKLQEADLILFAGVPGSHMVAQTIRDMAGAMKNAVAVKKIVWLADAISPIPGFEPMQATFVKEMTSRGLRVATTKEFAE